VKEMEVRVIEKERKKGKRKGKKINTKKDN
jgi:hypothetical protein